MTRIFSSSYSLDTFHAQTDYAEVKEQFYCFITTLAIKVDVLVIEKIPCYDPLKQNPGRLYGVMAGQLIKNVIKQKIPKSFLVGKIAN